MLGEKLTKACLAACLCAPLVGSASTLAYGQGCDVAIMEGRVMDPETKFDAIRNICVTGGKITAITESKITGKQVIDAKNHVVAPGFIDGHVHIVDSALGQKGILRDGVTTALDLEAGAYPVDQWYDQLAGRSQTNYGASVSAVGARTAVFRPKFKSTGNGVKDVMVDPKGMGADWVVRRATPDQREEILKIVDHGLSRGGLGVGPPVGYMTEGFSSEELLGMQKLAAKYGRFTHIHTRFSSQIAPTSAILAFQEAIAPSIAYGGGVIIAHFTAQALAQTEASIAYIDDLRARGVDVILEVYPYNFGAAGNGVQADYLKPDNFQKNMGRTYKDIIDTATGKPLDKAGYNKMVKDDPGHPVMFYNATEKDNLTGIGHPDVLIGCDCFPYTDPKTGKMITEWDTPWTDAATHPRTVGAHAKVLKLTREKKIKLTLMQAISKMSYQYAKFLQDNGVAQMAFKGRVQVGADADITIFDPNKVTDNSTLKKGENALPSTGIPYVLVNGTVVVKNSKVLKGIFPGRAVRAPIQKH